MSNHKDRKTILLANYCEKCKNKHQLLESGNFLYENKCEICGRTGLTYFSGGLCIINGKNENHNASKDKLF